MWYEVGWFSFLFGLGLQDRQLAIFWLLLRGVSKSGCKALRGARAESWSQYQVVKANLAAGSVKVTSDISCELVSSVELC